MISSLLSFLIYFPTFVLMDYSGKIRNLRKEKGLSQAEMAEMIGISQAAYGKIESGFTKSITIEVGKGISKALNIPFGELFEIDGTGTDIQKFETTINELQKKVTELEERLKERKEIIDLLQTKIDAYKKFVFISAQTYSIPYITKIDIEIESAKSEKEKANLIDRKKKFLEGVESLFQLYVDMGLLSKEELKKFRNEEEEIYFSILKDDKN